MIRIGLDVDGKFADVVALDEATGATEWTNVLTDAESPSAGALAARDPSYATVPASWRAGRSVHGIS